MFRRWLGATIMMILLIPVGSRATAIVGTEPVETLATGGLNAPISIAIGQDGTFYIADTNNHRIQQVSPSGIVSTILGTSGASGPGSNELNKPSSVVVGSDGSLYVADRQNHRIQKRDAGGVVSTVLGVTGTPGGADNELRSPVGLAIDSENNLYIADLYNHRVQKLTPEGVISTVSGTNGVAGGAANQFRSPTGVAVDSLGNVYVADVYNHRVQVITPAGEASTLAGTTGSSGDAYNYFRSPSGVAVDSFGNVYIADRWNHRVQRVAPDGVLTTVVGVTQVAGSGPAELRAPSGVLVDQLNNLYVVDTNNDRVQVINADNEAPIIEITSPVPHSILRPDSPVTARFACTDSGGSLVTACEAAVGDFTIANGEKLRLGPSGFQTLTITATDGHGNRSTHSVAFRLLPPDETRSVSDTYVNSSGSAGSVSRLYLAVLGRQPDAEGHNFWVEEIERGVALEVTGQRFVNGPEYRAAYADLRDDEFVENLYLNVLNRPAEPTGAYFWLTRLSEGISREEVILWFSESPEFKTLSQTS